jgi:hypothetical protein
MLPNTARYIVVNENTLGYWIGKTAWIGVLHASVLKGAVECRDTTIHSFGKTTRPATTADFNEYRVAVPRGFVEPAPAQVTASANIGQESHS